MTIRETRTGLVRRGPSLSAPSRTADPVSSLCLTCADVLGVTGAGLMLTSGGPSLGCVGVLGSRDRGRRASGVHARRGPVRGRLQ